MIDSHCHLDSDQFDADRDAVIQRALDSGVEKMVAIGTGDGPPDLEAGIRLADRHPCLYATVGVHPHDAAKAKPETFTALRGLAKHPKVIAIGEIGLDYHYDFSPREVQCQVFIEQMRVAAEAAKPIVIHTREAWADTISLIKKHWTGAGIMHCFSGGPDEAREALDLGFYLSFAGILTFPKATALQEAARTAPADRILVETDAPYLAPVPKRGKRNEPAYVMETARKLSELRGTTLEAIEAATTENFRRLCLRYTQ